MYMFVKINLLSNYFFRLYILNSIAYQLTVLKCLKKINNLIANSSHLVSFIFTPYLNNFEIVLLCKHHK